MTGRSKVSPDVLNDILARTNLVALVARRVTLARKGLVFWGLCPFHSEKTPSFKVDNERRAYHCFGCGAGGDAIDWLTQTEGLTFPDAVRRLAGAIQSERRGDAGADPHHHRHADREQHQGGKANDLERRAAKANGLWPHRQPLAGSPAKTYLREARGYAGPIPATLGFLAPAKPGHHPAMIAAFGIAEEPEPGVLSIRDDHVRAVHLTLLKPDGSGKAEVKPDKIMMGVCKGSPIVLAPPNDLLGLAISEGIEDGLSIHEATGLGVWAAGSAGLMRALASEVPEYVESVSIMAHDDPAGLTGARSLADDLQRRGIEVAILRLGMRHPHE